MSTDSNSDNEEPGGSRLLIFSGPAYAVEVDIMSFSALDAVDKQLVI